MNSILNYTYPTYFKVTIVLDSILNDNFSNYSQATFVKDSMRNYNSPNLLQVYNCQEIYTQIQLLNLLPSILDTTLLLL